MAKYLGIYLDSHLKFNKYIKEPIEKARRVRAAQYSILNNISIIPTRAKLSIYKMYIKTQLTYIDNNYILYLYEYIIPER